MSRFTVDAEKCNLCGLCVADCPAGIIIKRPQALPFLASGGAEWCINCGHCVAVCPTGAVSLDTMKPEECTLVSPELALTTEQVEQFLKSRRSTRVYKDEIVPRDILAKMIDIARYAPTGGNRQTVQWLVVENPELVKRLSWLVTDWMRIAIAETPEMADRLPLDRMMHALERSVDPILRGAPHVVLAHAPKDQPSAQQDGLIALTYLELAAYSLGLGACWAGFLYFAVSSYRPIRDALQFPSGHHCLGAMMVGYPKHRFHRIPLRNESKVIWR